MLLLCAVCLSKPSAPRVPCLGDVVVILMQGCRPARDILSTLPARPRARCEAEPPCHPQGALPAALAEAREPHRRQPHPADLAEHGAAVGSGATSGKERYCGVPTHTMLLNTRSDPILLPRPGSNAARIWSKTKDCQGLAGTSSGLHRPPTMTSCDIQGLPRTDSDLQLQGLPTM